MVVKLCKGKKSAILVELRLNWKAKRVTTGSCDEQTVKDGVPNLVSKGQKIKAPFVNLIGV